MFWGMHSLLLAVTVAFIAFHPAAVRCSEATSHEFDIIIDIGAPIELQKTLPIESIEDLLLPIDEEPAGSEQRQQPPALPLTPSQNRRQRPQAHSRDSCISTECDDVCWPDEFSDFLVPEDEDERNVMDNVNQEVELACLCEENLPYAELCRMLRAISGVDFGRIMRKLYGIKNILGCVIMMLVCSEITYLIFTTVALKSINMHSH